MKERKIYETIKKWNDRKISFKRAQLMIGYSEQHMYRLKKKLKEKGKDGFIHGNRGRKPKITIDQSLSDNILLYYQTEYQGFNFNHYKIMLEREKNIYVSYTKIYTVLTIKNGILSPKARKSTKIEHKKKTLKRKKEYKDLNDKELNIVVKNQLKLEDSTPRIPRTGSTGENIEFDASSYIFFGDKKTNLHLSIDTATNACTGGYIDYQETLVGYYNVLYQILINYGIPLKITTDGRTIFEYLSKKMKTDEKAYFTQFKHACDVLGIELNVTSKSQKKPRVERYNEVFQDRLSNELKHKNIHTIDEANKYLIEEFIPAYNKEFALKPFCKQTSFERITNIEELNYILAVLSIRTFNNGNSISYKSKIYLPYSKDNKLVCYRKGTKCTVIEAFDGNLYAQIYGEIHILKELQYSLNENETLEEYYEKVENDNLVNELPSPQNDWNEETLDDIFENINKEYNIHDSHNPR